MRITQTIEPILKSRSVSNIYADANLKGQGLGDLEGLTYDKVDFGNPRDADVQPGVEKFDDFVQRLKDVTGHIIAIEAPKVGETDRVVLVASHGVCITSIFKVLEDTAPCNGFAPPVALRGPDAYEVRWTDSDDVAKMVVAEPSKLPIKDEQLEWEKIDGKPFLVSICCSSFVSGIFANWIRYMID
jgi:broad specificity phosphatase PhoE